MSTIDSGRTGQYAAAPPPRTPRRRRGLVACVLALIVCVVAAGVVWRMNSGHSADGHDSRGSFPAVDLQALPADRAAIVQVAHTQFDDPGPATKYSQGAQEAWCADFVSWVWNTAGVPMSNPNSGSWRIPGVYTLQDYLQSVHRLHLQGSDYQPQPGDLVLWKTGSRFGAHTNLVLSDRDGRLTTVGGNQPGGITVTTEAADDSGILGFGSPA